MGDVTQSSPGLPCVSPCEDAATENILRSEQMASIEILRQAMDAKKLSIRDLASQSGIHKTRLGGILHRTPAKRSCATLLEYQRLLRTLGISLIQASVRIEASVHADESTRTLYELLAQLYVEIPPHVIAELDELNGIDTSIIRPEWSGPLTKAITRKLVDTSVGIQGRRDSLAQM